MRYTASAIGLLTRQYRSVLKKCFLINMGLFALGAVSANAAVPTPTLDKLHEQDPITYPNPSAYMYIEGAADNYDVKADSDYAIIGLKDMKKGTEDYITWSAPLDEEPSEYTWSAAGSYVKVDSTAGTIKGGIRLKMSHNGDVPPTNWNRWYTYVYTAPYGLDSITQKKLENNITSDKVNHKVFTRIYNGGNHSGGAIYNTKNISTVNIISDFIGNIGTHEGGAISNYDTDSDAANIGSIQGNFIGNNTSSYSGSGNAPTRGGAISNYSNSRSASINSIEGYFFGNSAYSFNKSASFGGAISNYTNYTNKNATINSIVGDFVGNYLAQTSGYEAYGGAISNYASSYGSNTTPYIGSIVGDFIGNNVSTTSHYAYGGAISNSAEATTTIATIGSIEGNFVGNSAVSSSSGAQGEQYITEAQVIRLSAQS